MANTTYIVKLYNGRKGIVHVGENGSLAVPMSKWNHLRAICAMAPTENAIDFFIKLNIEDLDDPRDDRDLRVSQIRSLIFDDEEVLEIVELEERPKTLTILEDEDFSDEDIRETILRT
jgi:hypothetical protein